MSEIKSKLSDFGFSKVTCDIVTNAFLSSSVFAGLRRQMSLDGYKATKYAIEIAQVVEREIAFINVLSRLLEAGCTIEKQYGQWYIFEHNGEGVVCGDTFREMCDKLPTVDVEYHERRHLERDRS